MNNNGEQIGFTQASEFMLALMKAGVTKDLLQTVMDSKRNHKAKQVVGLLSGNEKILSVPEDPLTQWEMFYKEMFGVEADFSEIKVRNKIGFSQLVVILKELKLAEAYDLSIRYLNNNKPHNYPTVYNKLAELENHRTPHESYAFHIRDNFTATPFPAKYSERMKKEMELSSVTLLEYFVIMLFYWWITDGKHLDGTEGREVLCLASQYSSNEVTTNVCRFYEGIHNYENRFSLCGHEVNFPLRRKYYYEIVQ